MRIQDSEINVDVEKTAEYYRSNTLCDCLCCRNFYAQAKERFGKLEAFLSEFGISLERPDELESVEADNTVMYLTASYSVCGKLPDSYKKTVEISDGGMDLKVVIGDSFSPNEQTGDYFMVSVYDMNLPWVLDEPIPEVLRTAEKLPKIKRLFKKD